MHDHISLKWFVIPGLTRNPVSFWIPAFAGKTSFIVVRVIILKLRTHHSELRTFGSLPFARRAQAKEAAPLAWATVSGMSLGP